MDEATVTRTSGDLSKAGLATLLAGLAIILGAIGSEIADPLWVLVALGFAGLIYGVPRIHRHQAPQDGAPGTWGARLVVFGGSVVVALAAIYLIWELVGTPPEDGPGWANVLWPIGFFSFLIGIILFSIGSIRAKVVPQAAPILMLVGLIAGVAIDMATGQFFEEDPEGTAWGFLLGVPLFGLGVAWIGYTLWKRESEGPVSTSLPAA